MIAFIIIYSLLCSGFAYAQTFLGIEAHDGRLQQTLFFLYHFAYALFAAPIVFGVQLFLWLNDE